LKASGPTNQLYSLIKELPQKVNVNILTLSKEVGSTRIDEFKGLGVNVTSLDLSRFGSLFFAKNKINETIINSQPNIVHSQGIRADLLMSKLPQTDFKWFSTSHNFPFEDYVMKFGFFKGKYMAKKHLIAFKKCNYLISCSNTVRDKLLRVGVQSKAIQNGIDIKSFPQGKFQGQKESIKSIVFISVGSLIPRKNMAYILRVFKRINVQAKLIILGEGIEIDAHRDEFESPTIIFAGNVVNVKDYLAEADVFISSSLSEGLPNTVLEALAVGKICYLSDIPAHREIYEKSNGAVSLFPLGDDGKCLEILISKSKIDVCNINFNDAINTVHQNFTSEIMSKNYYKYYTTAGEF
jgi:glycosyltransferase involved in cell wall biosynthesis